MSYKDVIDRVVGPGAVVDIGSRVDIERDRPVRFGKPVPELQVGAVYVKSGVDACGPVVAAVYRGQMVIGLFGERGPIGGALLKGDIGPEDDGVVGVEAAFHIQV